MSHFTAASAGSGILTPRVEWLGFVRFSADARDEPGPKLLVNIVEHSLALALFRPIWPKALAVCADVVDRYGPALGDMRRVNRFDERRIADNGSFERGCDLCPA